MNSPNTKVCENSEAIMESLITLQSIKKLKTSLGNNITRIIIEESIALKWNKTKAVIFKILNLSPYFPKMIIWKIPQLKKIISVFLETFKNRRTIGPCKVADFLEEMLALPDIDETLLFFKWIFESPQRCKRTFKIIS